MYSYTKMFMCASFYFCTCIYIYIHIYREREREREKEKERERGNIMNVKPQSVCPLEDIIVTLEQIVSTDVDEKERIWFCGLTCCRSENS